METRPGYFFACIEYIGFSPEECQVIEDTRIGVKAAIAGGFDVFGYDPHFTTADFDNQATKNFYAMDELLPMISGNP